MTSTVAPVQTPSPVTVRLWDGVDRLRGFAIVVMILDHVTLAVDGPTWLRLTVGRLAMPLFFIVSGSLVTAPKPRWALVALWGVLVPVAVPWVDSPNVLLLYVIGALILALFRAATWPVWALVAVALALSANGLHVAPGNSYDLAATVALMALGSMVGPARLHDLGMRLPGVLRWPGRHPLSIYVGHLLLLQFAVLGVASLTAAS